MPVTHDLSRSWFKTWVWEGLGRGWFTVTQVKVEGWSSATYAAGWMDAESVFRHPRCTDRTEIPGSFMSFSILQVRPEEPWPCSLTSVGDLQDVF